MSKKAFAALILLIIAIFAGIGWYLYTKTQNPSATDPGNNQNSDLFPFGPGGTVTNPGSNGSNGGDGTTTTPVIDISGGEQRLPRLRQISTTPTAGSVASSTASSTVIRFIERATGHIFEADSEKTPVTKISTITIPKVYEGLFTANATKLLIRYLKDDNLTIRTFYAKIATTTRPEQALEGLFLPDDIKSVSVRDNRIFYMTLRDSSEQGIVADIDGSNKVAIFNSTFTEWASRWTSQNFIAISPKPSSAAQGTAYLLNSSTGIYTKTVGGIAGLETLPNESGTLVAFSGSDGNLIGTSVLKVDTGVIQSLGANTLMQKCVWSKKNTSIIYCAVPRSPQSASYPDDWYKGKISFNDTLWQINALSGETKEILSPELQKGISMDMINLSLDQNENIILFTNKKDMTVWRYRLSD